MKRVFDDVVPGFPVGGSDMAKLKREVLALLEGMGLKKGSYKIPNFKDSKIDKIEIAFTVSAIDDDVVTWSRYRVSVVRIIG